MRDVCGLHDDRLPPRAEAEKGRSKQLKGDVMTKVGFNNLPVDAEGVTFESYLPETEKEAQRNWASALRKVRDREDAPRVRDHE